ncbi:MAG: hypothetical protein OXN83_00780 [Oligoflexia bacterium]|nr:hypothetical protein [Oligoflexia bacterium]
MKNGSNPFFSYTAYKKDMLSLFEEALKDTKKDITEIKKATLKNTNDITEIKKILTNHLNHEHKAINKKLDQILQSLKN